MTVERGRKPAPSQLPGGLPKKYHNPRRDKEAETTLARVPEEMWKNGKDSLRASAMYRKHVQQVDSATDGSLISV